MNLILSAALLATVATAQLTTSFWAPYGPADRSLVASVVSLQGNRTVLSLGSNGRATTSTYFTGTAHLTVTVAGLTYMAHKADLYLPNTESSVRPHVESVHGGIATFECTRENIDAVPTCTTTIRGMGSSSSSETAQTTNIVSGELQQHFQNTADVVITAGLEKLSTDALATPTGSPVGPANTRLSTGSVDSSTDGSSESTQATGAAGPLRSTAPDMAWLGVAAVFFV